MKTTNSKFENFHSLSSENFVINNSILKLSARFAVWDIDVFGFSVVQIDELVIFKISEITPYFLDFENWLIKYDVKILSCRLSCDALKESIFLEQKGFSFIEMTLSPFLKNVQLMSHKKSNLIIAKATQSDLPAIQDIARNSFKYERYYIDPRLEKKLSDERYSRWVVNSFMHEKQQVLKILEGEKLLGFFIIENISENKAVYWNLTAIAPDCIGQGYGLLVWEAMLALHKEQGIETVSTNISVRNIPVLNLYAKLGFRFQPPLMTFHKVFS